MSRIGSVFSDGTSQVTTQTMKPGQAEVSDTDTDESEYIEPLVASLSACSVQQAPVTVKQEPIISVKVEAAENSDDTDEDDDLDNNVPEIRDSAAKQADSRGESSKRLFSSAGLQTAKPALISGSRRSDSMLLGRPLRPRKSQSSLLLRATRNVPRRAHSLVESLRTSGRPFSIRRPDTGSMLQRDRFTDAKQVQYYFNLTDATLGANRGHIYVS